MMMAVYNHWAGLTGLPLELEVWHYNSIGKLVQYAHYTTNSCKLIKQPACQLKR